MKRSTLKRKTPLKAKRATPRRVKATCSRRGCKRTPVAEILLCKTHAKQEADRLFSLIVRARGACEDCGSTQNLQAAHGVSRRYLAVRWDEINCYCLCQGCHMRWTHDPLGWEEWIDQRGVISWDRLRWDALSQSYRLDYALLLPRLRQRLKELTE